MMRHGKVYYKMVYSLCEGIGQHVVSIATQRALANSIPKRMNQEPYLFSCSAYGYERSAS